MKIESLTPNVVVRDVQKSLDFYISVLGFKLDLHVPEQPPYIFASVTAGSAVIFLNDQKTVGELPLQPGKAGMTLSLYMKVQAIDDWFSKVEASGAKIVMPMTTQFYGMKEFAFEDPDGWVLMFAEPV